MVSRPISGILHIFVYVGFIIVNFEMLEIIFDGISGSHRLFSFTGPIYTILISTFEFFALSVIIACIIFLARRNLFKVKRFWNKEMTLWPRSDAAIILITEVFLMSAILIMNASDSILQDRSVSHYINVGSFPLSSLLIPFLNGLPTNTLIFLERFGWWFHIIGVLVFLNYIPYSKHFHVFLAFLNVYFSRLEPTGKMSNMPCVTKEVKLMLDQTFESQPDEENSEEVVFGAKDVKDLTWKNLMDSYTCTECGRCTSRCPANITGKQLSPRKIVMDVRDHLEFLSNRNTRKNLINKKSLFDFIQAEEIWACTTCNACAIECPVNIEPLSVILEMRRYAVLEDASAPAQLNAMFTNIENNGAPWQFSPEDRMLWAEGLDMPLLADKFNSGEKPEYLFWIGSAGAFDDRYKKVIREFVKILTYLKVDYAVLGTEETDSGDAARRAGNEMLFQMQAMMNIEVMNGYEVKKIITCDPHDYNTFKNEYPEFGGNYEVIHHSQFLQKMIGEGKINITNGEFKNKNITFHDPCYLGRANGEYQAPRDVLNAIPSEKVEMKLHKSFALCCGAGGGQMFKEAEKGDKEIFIERTEEAIETGADIIATACPFCMTMMTDGIKYKNKEEEMKNYDIAELVSISLNL